MFTHFKCVLFSIPYNDFVFRFTHSRLGIVYFNFLVVKLFCTVPVVD